MFKVTRTATKLTTTVFYDSEGVMNVGYLRLGTDNEWAMICWFAFDAARIHQRWAQGQSWDVEFSCKQKTLPHTSTKLQCKLIPHPRYFLHDDIIKWKHFPRYRPFVRGVHWSPVNSPHKGRWRGALMFSLICTWINSLVHRREAGDLRRQCVHCDVIVMWAWLPEIISFFQNWQTSWGGRDMLMTMS